MNKKTKRKEYSSPEQFLPGMREYEDAWGRLHGAYTDKLFKYDLDITLRPKTILGDVVPSEGGVENKPLTTFDETIRGDGLLADGVPLGSELAVKRSASNLRHIRKVAFPDEVTGLKAPNVPWNWTKGRVAGANDEEGDVIHRVGETPEFPPIGWDKGRVHINWPLATWKRDRKKRSAPKKGFDAF